MTIIDDGRVGHASDMHVTTHDTTLSRRDVTWRAKWNVDLTVETI